MTTKALRITFVMPGYSNEPIGGYKIVYEHANRLAAKGHKVSVVLCRRRTPRPGPLAPLLDLMWQLRVRLKTPSLVSWFEVDKRVHLRLVPDLTTNIPHADITVATMFNTVRYVAEYGPEKGKRVFFVQSYEDWASEPESFDEAWSLPMPRLVIAKWLAQLSMEKNPANATCLIPNAIDHEMFRIKQPIEGRPPRIGLLIHDHPVKGTEDGIAALTMLKAKHPAVAAIGFGTSPRRPALPDWVEYKQLPTQNQLVDLYNCCSIFLHTSHQEGFALTPLEAMACGCAVVAAGNDGVKEYSTHEKNALLTPIKSPDALFHAIDRLIQEPMLRQQLAKQGQSDAQQFNWESSSAAMESALKTILDPLLDARVEQ